MIPAKIESTSITTIREKGAKSIVDWFEQHQPSLYTLGWSYLRNQQQIEELFYQSIIKLQEEIRRFKSEASFETWVISIFIRICRELSHDCRLQVSEESVPGQDIFNALGELEESEREAVVLTYVKGISKEEVAYLLQVSVEKLKELLFSGIQSLRKELGYGAAFNGCKEYQKDYFDYLERNMERSKKIDFEIHIYHCHDCQEDLATFQEVMVYLSEKMEALPVPADFIENVKERLTEKENQRRQKIKKRTRMALICAGVFAVLMSISFFTGAFTYVYYTWTEENPQLRTYLQAGLGERLNLEAESGGMKIKIKGAIADDVQTLVYYEIEDTKEDNQYGIQNQDGVYVVNQYKIMNPKITPRYYPPDLESEVNNQKKNVYQGKLSLQPLSKDNGTIKLKITKLQKLIRDSSNRNLSSSAYEEMAYKTGDWSFEIPVTKQPSIEYALDQETEVKGIPVRLDKLTIAPTATILHYRVKNEHPEKRIEYLNLDNLEVNHKKVKADIYGSSMFNSQQDMNWSTYQTSFDPLFGEKPKEVNVHFGSVNLSVEDHKTIELDPAREYPQTFEYAGSTISIDKLELGQPSKLVISNHEIKNRAFESLQFDIVGEDASHPISMETNSEGVLVDKNGVEYDQDEIPFVYKDIEQPRYFMTVQTMQLTSDTGDVFIPKSLEIFGYNTTKYVDHVVKISLD
jgi:DNA-directed RNA polymerase specialized sigma24 family protein